MAKIVRITFLLRKRDDITHEQFHNWSEEHPKIWLSVPIIKQKLFRYSQFHADEKLDLSATGLPPNAPFDGAATMWAKSLEDLHADLPVGKGSKLITVKLDSSVPSDAAAAVAALKGDHGIRALDIVIANAGIASDGGLVRDTTVDNIKKHFEVNTIGPVVLFQAVADLLQASKTGKPLFVAISTLIGSIGSMEHLVALPPTSSPYGGSKAALNWFIRRLHFEEPWLTSFVVHPGLVETDMAVAAFGSGSTEQLSVYGSITVETSVTSLVNVIDKASKELSGTFQNYDGTPIAW